MSEAKGLLEKAHRALADAQVLLERGSAEGATNRAYYAAFYVASAALRLVGEKPHTHSGTISRFQARFVRTGHVPDPPAGVFPFAFMIRQRSDYEAFSQFDTAAAADLLRDVEAFVQATEALVKNLEAGEG
ncbi:MAG TPA: HEPN domain-containing protein [Rhodothermales bacterium]|nr:HEPN domain-containing protein [Rhodothermales bacterium]